MSEEYIRLPKSEKMRVIGSIIEAVHPYGLMIADSIQSGNLPYSNSLNLSFRIRPQLNKEYLNPNQISWSLIEEPEAINDYRDNIQADISHRLVKVNHPGLPVDFSETLAVAANDVKNFISETGKNYAKAQFLRYSQNNCDAKPIQRDFLGSAIEGIISVEQCLSLMWEIASQNGELNDVRNLDDILLFTIKMATGKSSFIHAFSRSLPFSSLVSTISSRKGPTDLAKIGYVEDIPFMTLGNSPSYFEHRRTDSSNYWQKHLPCPAVFCPSSKIQSRVLNSLDEVASSYCQNNSDVTSMDWIVLAICKQIAYRENRPGLAETIQMEFDQRIDVLREHELLGVKLKEVKK
jgi:hypothetical protein